MFTGLIQRVGRLVGLARDGAGGARVTVESGAWTPALEHGESVAVEGVCLTVCEATGGVFVCDVLEETLDRTALAGRRVGCRLNLERALRVGDRLGGHLVQGHVDGVVELVERRRAGRDWVLAFACAPELAAELAPKGSVAIDGVSLTVAALAESRFDVHVIPTTCTDTTLGERLPGEKVNVETDIIGKYVRRYLETTRGGGGRLTLDDLVRTGFV